MNETAPAPRAGKVVHPRLPDEVHARVQEFATRERRPMTNALVYLIERGLDAVEPTVTPTPGRGLAGLIPRGEEDVHLR